MSVASYADLKGAIKTPSEVLERKVIMVSWDLSGGKSSTLFPIYLDFTPDIMEVKYIHYLDGKAADQTWMSVITSNICDGIANLGTFSNVPLPCVSGNIFRIEKQIRGNYNFSALTLAGAADVLRTSYVVIMLEFTKLPGKKSDLP